VLIQSGVKAVGATVKDLPLPEQCVIVAVIRKGTMVVPRGATKMEVGDEILAVTDSAGAEQLAELFTLHNG
jgi:trk system potassium uptake protein TrkA